MRRYLSCRFLFKHVNGFPTKLVRKPPHKTFHHEFVVLTQKPSPPEQSETTSPRA
ncbi:unnamed protein product [Brassica napus]|uniref:(rape) hypothetical protein n=1 Tax=Brassica napus TaxID=3708 RepID=A0A816JGM8_BRANA|nr:unnamed protein product [Brassica napus]